jgi:hypothetical protein
MTVYSKHSYEDQDDGRILKVARKQQYIMFPAPIAFLNDELKAELGMKFKKGRRRQRKVLLIESSNESQRQGLQDLCVQYQEI